MDNAYVTYTTTVVQKISDQSSYSDEQIKHDEITRNDVQANLQENSLPNVPEQKKDTSTGKKSSEIVEVRAQNSMTSKL